MKKSEIEKLLWTEVLRKFGPEGFKGKLSSPTSRKTLDGAVIQLNSTIIASGTFPSCQFYTGFQLNVVEDWVNKINPPDPKLNHDFSYTFIFPWYIFFRSEPHIPGNFKPYEIQGDDYFSLIVFEYHKLYKEKIEPFLLKCMDLDEMDTLFNSKYSTAFPYHNNAVEWAIKGIIIRFLTRKSELPGLIEKYQQILTPIMPTLREKFNHTSAYLLEEMKKS